jgi:uncharacterized protein (TIGR03083 family)
VVAETFRPTGQSLSFGDQIVALETETAALRALLRDAESTTPVPTCPGWTLADLAEHVGRVQRRTTEVLRRRLRTPISSDGVPAPPAAWSGYDAWLADGAAEMAAQLRSDGPDLDVWVWTPSRHGSEGWARRMLHEAAVHRADAEFALGHQPVIAPAIAADGIDELLDSLPYAAPFAPGVRELTGDGETLHWHATDTSPGTRAEWLITLEPDGYRWTRAHARGAVAVRATVSDLYLFAYGRRTVHDPGIEVIGDTLLLSHWVTHSRLL